jgi:hypothetical protein
MIRLTLILPVLLLTLLVGSPASADFQKGWDAAQKGDHATALKEWMPLAKQGNVGAQFNLGVMYEKGNGVPQGYKTAINLYKLSAEQGYFFAQYNLGVMYHNGLGVPQDYKTAIKWYKLAAEQGYADVQYNLGTMYVNGTGTLQDYTRAHMWWNIAASQGDKGARTDRDKVEKRMPPTQLETAQQLARECVQKNYKGC